MKISLAICTWNRAELLEQTLESLTALRDPGCPWELLVVDNGSTDRTPDVLRDFEDRLPLRVVHEPKLGHSNARNAAVEAVDGDYTVWTDDDVLVSPDWLAEYRAGFERHPDASFFGGPVDPWLDGPPPEWFDVLVHDLDAGFVFALRDLFEEETPLPANRLPFGANMAFRSDALGDLRFDPRLGLKGEETTRGEETAMMRALIDRGETGWWLPRAHVRHWVPRERMTLEFVHDWWVGAGAVFAIRHPLPEGTRTMGGVPLRWIQTWVSAEIRYRIASLGKDWPRILGHLRTRARARGAIMEFRARASGRRRVE